MSGAWVFVCGPSGSGKDSVMAYAQEALAARTDLVFARRLVTRPVQPDSDHDPVTQAAFEEMLQAGGLRWYWHAHGFSYGIARHYDQAVRAGNLVVVNGSREHVSRLPPSPDVRVVHISADQDRLANRLLQRGRDTAGAVAQRLARNTRFTHMQADCVIVNNSELAVAGRQLANYLESSTISAGADTRAAQVVLRRTSA